MKRNVVVIGGGAAGMMAAGFAAESGNNVLLLEKNEKTGKKIFITGKGRCNITNAVEPQELIDNVPGNPDFLYSAFYSFTSQDVINFFESLGLRTKVERGNRVFPESDKSSDVVRALNRFLEKTGVAVHLNTAVKEILTENNRVCGVLTESGQKFDAASVIIATGGLSYPLTGSTGDGYRFAKKLGHNIVKTRPSLVSLVTAEKWVSELMGLSLKNTNVSLFDGKKLLYSEMGEMLFTHFGVSGPVILSLSRYALDYIHKRPKLIIDPKPALDEATLDARILRDFEKYVNRDFRNSLDDLLPQKMIPLIIEKSGIDPYKKIHDITREERKNLVHAIKNIELTIVSTSGFDDAVITAGGVDVLSIDPSTMKSKLIDGLYFAGEVIDVDAYTGGFNLQIAFSTGYLAGKNA